MKSSLSSQVQHADSATRGQTELPALGVALVLLTSTVVLGVFLANSALTAAERPSIEEQTAASLSERLVAADAPHTTRQNVLSAQRVEALDERTLRKQLNIPEDTDITVRLGGETLVEAGAADGTTTERVVLVERRTQEILRPDFDNSRTTTLPRRTSNATLTISPPSMTTVERVYANSRIVLSNETGLEGTFDVSLSSFATTTLRFEGVGTLADDSVRIEYTPPETTKAILEVRVDV